MPHFAAASSPQIPGEGAIRAAMIAAVYAAAVLIAVVFSPVMTHDASAHGPRYASSGYSPR